MQLKNVSLRIVGVLAAGGTGAFGVDQGNAVIVPITVAQRELLGISYFSTILVQADPDYDISFVTNRISFILQQDHGIANPDKDDFTIETQADILSLLGSITSVLTLFLAAIASISLVVGGIGIMNIMLVSVTERTREIGIRLAIGALAREVRMQFLTEAVVLCCFGGLIGLVLAFGLSFALAKAIDVPFVFSLSVNILSFVFSAMMGIIFGYYPARRASRLDPIEALRHE
mgnify:CR=1 FL=1